MKLRFFPEGYFAEGCYELSQVFGSTFVTIGGLTYLNCGDLGGIGRNLCLFCGDSGRSGNGAVIAGNGIVRGIIHCWQCGTLLTVRFDDASFAAVIENLNIDQRIAKYPWERQEDVLIQGDFEACHLMVGFATEMGLIPVYSTTRREVQEEQGDDGSVNMTHRFEHRRFRRYGK